MNVQSCIACDVHREDTTVVAGWIEGSGDVKTQYLGRVATRRESIELALEQWHEVVERMGRQWPSVVVVEAAGMSGVVEEVFAGWVDQVWRVDAYQLSRLRRGAKTDRLDAAFLAEAVLRGLAKPLWTPAAELVGWREALRTRRFLLKHRTATVNRLKGYARERGIRLERGAVWSEENRKNLLEGCGGHEGRRLSVEGMLRYLDALNGELRVLEKGLEKLYQRDEKAQLLSTLPGCGKCLALSLSLEIGEIERFRSADALRSYAGLARQVHESGGRSYHRGLVRQANVHLKWAFCQVAHEIGYMSSQQDPLAEKFHRLRWQLRNHPCVEIRVRTQIASQLCEIVYAMLRDGRGYEARWPGEEFGRQLQ